MFFLTAAGLVALIVYTYYTRQQVIDAEGASAQQAIDLKTSFDKTDKAIAATNRLAEEAARNTAESHRLADAATQSAAESRRLADEATKTAAAAAQANDLTRQLTREAARANDISKQALIGVQRAFMFTHGVQTEDVRMGILTASAVVAWKANLQWENSGNTPTKDLVITTHCVTSVNALSDPFALLITDPHNQYLTTQDTNAVFGPKQIDNAGVCLINYVVVMLTNILPASLHSYAFGTVNYRDGFTSNALYRTDFCYEMSVVGGEMAAEFQGIKNPPPASIVAHHCLVHNCADEECQKEDHDTAQLAKDSPPNLGWPPQAQGAPPPK